MPTIFFLNILKFIKTSLFSLIFFSLQSPTIFSVCAGTFLKASRTCSHIWYYALRNIDWIVSSRFWSIDMLRIHKYAFHHSRLISASIHIKLKMKRSITFFSAHCLGRENELLYYYEISKRAINTFASDENFYSFIRNIPGINCSRNTATGNNKI